MKDLIERQTAIDAVTPFDDEYRIRDAIEDLPSAQPEREKGHWISKMRLFAGKEYMQCSKCGYTLDLQCLVAYPYFCPGCGAEMRGRE